MKRYMTTLLIFLGFPLAAQAQSSHGYYRYPTIHRETVVFTSEGDLWRVGTGGGVAQRLTTHLGFESHPSISPDGATLAFSAQYEGPTEVYTMPVAGGLPTRRTYDGETARVIGWTPDGKILYTTRHYSLLPNNQLVSIDPETNEASLIELSQASEGVYEGSGKTLIFTRLAFQGSRTKRYTGGTAQNLWRFTQGEPEAVALTSDYTGTSKEPMWWNGHVYFLTDRDGTMNLWSMHESGGDLKQLTFHKGWDLQSPDLYAGRVVYQLGADLRLFEIAASTDRLLDVSLASDFDQRREQWIDKPMQYLTDLHISPDGDRIALTARGRVFVAPAESGRFVEATRKNGVRYRNALFLPDGESLLVLSDESGEFEFWKVPASGLGKSQILTKNGEMFRYEGNVSPDGKLVAFTDRNKRLWIHNIGSGKTKQIAESDEWGFSDQRWSPDSKWLAFVDFADNYFARINLYSVANGKTTVITSDRVESSSPAWSRDGQWLYFLSDRHFQSLVRSPWGPRQPEPYFDKTTKIYMMALTKGLRSPFRPDDELASNRKTPEGKKEDAADSVAVTVDFDGIRERVYEVSVAPGSYRNLMANDKRLFWTETETGLERKTHLMALEIGNDKPEPKTLVKNVRNFDLSRDGKKLAVRTGENIYVIDASGAAPAKLDDAKVDLSKWTFSVNPREEWRQMFVDAWRMERDFFYDPNMHGVDWEGLLKKHLPLVARVADRAELNDLIAQVVGELSALHMNVRGGDFREGGDQIALGSLGAVLVRDESAGGYRIDHIYKSEPDYLDRLAPLARPDLDAKEGDIIVAINGVPTLSVAHPTALLKNQASQQVRLELRSMPSGRLFSAVVEPISSRSERNLRYDEWEYTRRLKVDEAGADDIGYVHLRAMGGGNYSEWVRNFYPVYHRKGLIIDVRHNTGGNIDSWILEKLLRKAWFYWQPRVGKPYWNMQYAFRGHMVVLVNERTASDGEAFAEGFRRLGLGKVIGTRTWGGEIWLSNNTQLVDWGIARAPQTGVYSPDGEWLIEGHGVDPDMVVDNMPHATFKGEDAQLMAAIEYLQEQIRLNPVPVPPHPPYPNKAFDYETSTNGTSVKPTSGNGKGNE